MLVKKCSASSVVGEADSMALVGVLSTQLLHKRLVTERITHKATEREFSVEVVNRVEVNHRRLAHSLT